MSDLLSSGQDRETYGERLSRRVRARLPEMSLRSQAWLLAAAVLVLLVSSGIALLRPLPRLPVALTAQLSGVVQVHDDTRIVELALRVENAGRRSERVELLTVDHVPLLAPVVASLEAGGSEALFLKARVVDCAAEEGPHLVHFAVTPAGGRTRRVARTVELLRAAAGGPLRQFLVHPHLCKPPLGSVLALPHAPPTKGQVIADGTAYTPHGVVKLPSKDRTEPIQTWADGYLQTTDPSSGHYALQVLDRAGHLMRELPQVGLATQLSTDRRRLFMLLGPDDGRAHLDAVDLETGRRAKVADLGTDDAFSAQILATDPITVLHFGVTEFTGDAASGGDPPRFAVVRAGRVVPLPLPHGVGDVPAYGTVIGDRLSVLVSGSSNCHQPQFELPSGRPVPRPGSAPCDPPSLVQAVNSYAMTVDGCEESSRSCAGIFSDSTGPTKVFLWPGASVKAATFTDPEHALVSLVLREPSDTSQFVYAAAVVEVDLVHGSQTLVYLGGPQDAPDIVNNDLTVSPD